MKRISFFLALALIIASFGLANAQSVSVGATSGTWDDGGTIKIIPGAVVSFDLRLTNPLSEKMKGITNGFKIYGPASFTAAQGDTIISGFADQWGTIFGIKHLSCDGVNIDTVGFGGATSASGTGSIGLPAGFNDMPYRISTGGVAEGETLCIDSTGYPQGTWKWVGETSGNIFPAWEGPYCYLSETPACLGPLNFNGPLSMTGSHCDVMSFDFNADLNPINIPLGTLEWSASLGIINAATGAWSYAPSLADVGVSMSVTITVGNGTCSEDHVINLTFTNEAPVLTCPGTQAVSTGSDNTATVTAVDDCDGFTFTMNNDGGIGATIDPNTGVVTFNAAVAGVYTITVGATDGNLASECSFDVNAVAGSIYQVEIPCIGAPEGPIYQGQHASLPVNLNTGNAIDGYDLLIGYDNSALSFQSAAPGASLVEDGWEYFTYRYGANGNCSNACPTGLLRLTAIAETNNGPNHPTINGVTELAVIDFLVTNDRTLECQSIPVRFYWMDCGDNTLSTDGGNTLIVSETVFDGDEVLFPPNGSEIQNFDYGFPTYFGTQNSCIVPVGDKPVPIRDASFNNGCLFIACADAIDLRGDLNLNNVANEIADAVLYSNYFIYGIGQFIINTEGQIAASDVNADGLALSVADLVYLIRVIVGDALPYPKLAPVSAQIVDNNGLLSVNAEMGAALVVIEGNVAAELKAENMELISNFDGVNTRVLVYSLEGNTFSGEFLNANGTVVSYELGSADGATVNAKIIPANFELAQNYPNPFNPTTTVGFSIPAKSNVTLLVYNVTGQKVAEFSGAYEAGVHTIEWDASAMASGIYFYKLNAGDFSDTKKMVLLK
jgi:hypothetical protein